MIFEVTNSLGEKLRLQPKVGLYSVWDFMGTEMPGLAIILDEVDASDRIQEEYGVLTVSFGEFIGAKDCAYIDTNNMPFADQLLQYGIAEDTGFTKTSGFCEYPLWHFHESFLQEIGGEYYRQYSEAFKQYMSFSPFGEDAEAEESEEPQMSGSQM